MPKLGIIFQALSDKTRRTIIEALKKKDCTPGELMQMVSMTKPSLSHHLHVLKQADLVIAERKGQNIVYSLNISVLEEVIGFVMNFLKSKDS